MNTVKQEITVKIFKELARSRHKFDVAKSYVHVREDDRFQM